ncbi:phospholipase D family protein [Comamonas aquatica]|uniref:phospholipase D family protein n=1 Tax=Comamonas aquatica TaxID=225991 RepID=UPI00320B312E
MPLHIQDPANPNSEYLVDTLLDACIGARAGGGAFAFLSAGGVQLLLKDNLFTDFLGRGRFELLFGVDAITDTAAIRSLVQVRHEYPNFDARAFLPTHAKSIFHPKVAWFDQGNGGFLITGSGNLTAGGLRWNIEAYAVERLDAPAMARLREQWDDYLMLMSECQFDPQDTRVVALLERNAARRREMQDAGIVDPSEAGDEVTRMSPAVVVKNSSDTFIEQVDQPADEVPQISSETQILVAEIPRASNRWGQANFDQATFFDFFGASNRVQRRVYFFHLRDDNTLGVQEVRPAVAVLSHNYRFELDAASGLAYPDDGRPLGVFAKVGARTFIYMLLMPGSAGHAAMARLLDKTATAPPGRMRRIVYRAVDVKGAWPTAPFWGRLTVRGGRQ